MRAASQPDFRFPKSRRLIRSSEYQSVIAAGHRSKDALFIVYVQSSHQTLGRLGVTVSRRVAHKAVDRNRIKRAIKESFRHQQQLLLGLDAVAIARASTRKAETQEIILSLKKHWQTANQQHGCSN